MRNFWKLKFRRSSTHGSNNNQQPTINSQFCSSSSNLPDKRKWLCSLTRLCVSRKIMLTASPHLKAYLSRLSKTTYSCWSSLLTSLLCWKLCRWSNLLNSRSLSTALSMIMLTSSSWRAWWRPSPTTDKNSWSQWLTSSPESEPYSIKISRKETMTLNSLASSEKLSISASLICISINPLRAPSLYLIFWRRSRNFSAVLSTTLTKAKSSHR